MSQEKDTVASSPKPDSRFAAIWPIVLITALFFFWGMANNLNDILIPQFKKAFTLTDLQSGLVQSAFYAGYFFLALPAGFFMRKYGYKAVIITGLCLFALGAFLFYPAAEIRQYYLFLGALFVIASGLAFLETSANPLMTILGDEKHAAFRLNLAQAFNPLGSLVGLWVGQTFILSGLQTIAEADYVREAKAVQTPYLVIGAMVLIWALLIAFNKFPKAATNNTHDSDEAKLSIGQSIGGLLKHKHFLMGVAAQFFYVGAQVGIWSYTIRYAQSEIGITDKAAASYVIASLLLFTAGRFIGTFLMRYMSATLLLGVFAILNIGLTAYAAGIGGLYGLYALVGCSFFMSIMFPTIFATSVRGLGPLTKTGASFLVMSIIGGAILTVGMGWISDTSHIRTAIIVPLACFAVVAAYGFSSKTAARDA
ncbi:MAG: L-fucose:H+ symporter permease [Asticcacaulis sp.]